MSRLQTSRSWHGNKVGEAEFERDAKAHAEKHDLKRHAPSASKNNVSAGPTQVVVQNVATFKDVVFLRDDLFPPWRETSKTGLKRVIQSRSTLNQST